MEIINYPIKPLKEKAWHYKSHPYFTKQAHNVVSSYIEHYSNVGDTILDPFGGTGVTAIEGLRLGRKVIILDINPLACFLIEQTCKKINILNFKKAFGELKQLVAPIIENYYSLDDLTIHKLKNEYWYPQKIKLPNNSDFDFVHQLYTKRQLLSYSLLFDAINKIENEETKQIMKYVFSSTMAKVNLTYMDNLKRGAEGGGSSVFGKFRYWKPKRIAELNVWKNFAKKFEYIVKGKEKWDQLTIDTDVNSNLTVINGSVLNLTQYVSEKSIDYIYTDPPYGANIAYMDLSTMWNAWLFPEMFQGEQLQLNEFKQHEIIEGGDLQKKQSDYEDLFSKSFEQMSLVTKDNKWLSCVFAHKKLEFWNVIIDSCEDNGLEFKGSVYQPTNNSSVHYKTNPANVLCSQRIANFQKTFSKSNRDKLDNLQEFILNEIERACLSNNGAYIDRIYQNVLDRLLKNNVLKEAKKKGYLDLSKILDDKELFTYNETTGQYFVNKKEAHYKTFTEDYFRQKNEIKIVLSEILNSVGGATIDQIYKELFEVFADDKKFPLDKEDIIQILPHIAYQIKKTKKWVLSKNKSEQISLDFDMMLNNKLIKINAEGLTHSETIFRLIQLGGYLGFASWIGKREQIADSFDGKNFSELSLPKLPIAEKLTSSQLNKIQQIDVIWFDRLSIPRYAFEIEETTTILSGLERFKFLLEYDLHVAKHLFIVAPHSRRKTLTEIFTTSTYIGHPLFMENKVGFVFKEDLYRFYDDHTDKDFSEQNLKLLFESIDE